MSVSDVDESVVVGSTCCCGASCVVFSSSV